MYRTVVQISQKIAVCCYLLVFNTPDAPILSSTFFVYNAIIHKRSMNLTLVGNIGAPLN